MQNLGKIVSKGGVKMYRTQKIRIKKGHRFFTYCDQMCLNAKNLYNTTNFYIRQIFTAFDGDKELQPLQKEILNLIEKNLSKMNNIKIETVEKKRKKELKKIEIDRKEYGGPVLFQVPSKERKMTSYGFLDCLFKVTNQSDYLSLPGQVNQQVMKVVVQNWKSFFRSIKDYKINPTKYSGKPNLPKYAPKNGRKECQFSNQVCVIKEGKYLKFPLTKEKLNIGKLGTKGSLQQVRIVPTYGEYTIELITKELDIEADYGLDSNHIMGIDLGIDCLATIVDNTGFEPVIIKGKTIKSVNQYYNRQRAHYYSVLRQGKGKNEGTYHSNRLLGLDRKRFYKVKDYFHKTSFHIVEIALKRKVSKIVIGMNKGWKKEVELAKKMKQHFKNIPHTMLINMISYKAEKYGIEVIIQEESYTPKQVLSIWMIFQPLKKGKRRILFSVENGSSVVNIKRKRRKSFTQTLMQQETIIRKVVPDAFAKGIEGVMSRPLVLSIR